MWKFVPFFRLDMYYKNKAASIFWIVYLICLKAQFVLDLAASDGTNQMAS